MNFIRDYSLYLGWGSGKGREGILVKGLQIEFDINKVVSNQLTPSVSKVRVFNLNRDQSAALQGEAIDIRLLVGYVGQPLVEVLLGRAKEVSTKKQGADIITELVVAEGFGILNNTSVFGTIPGGKTLRDVIVEVAKQAGMTINRIDSGRADTQLLWGYPLEGTPRQILEEICFSYQLDYSISGNALLVKDSGSISNDQQLAIVLNEDTGLLGIPEADYWKETAFVPNEKGKSKKVKKTVDGIKVRALLNPAATPGAVLRLERKTQDEIPNGWYYITSADYTGSFNGQAWEMTLQCVRIEHE